MRSATCIEPPSNLLCLGINHQSAKLHILEQLSFSEEQINDATLHLKQFPSQSQLGEVVILSTCNRVEIYATSPSQDFSGLEQFLSEAKGLGLAEIQPHLYRFTDTDAIQHLMKVAAGLDSLLLGESQILGQISRALETAQVSGSAGPILTSLFQHAIHAGKRAQAETRINRHPASLSSLAASLAQQSLGDLAKSNIVILGAGEMAGLAAGAVHKRGANHLTILNRNLANAQKLADRWQAQAGTYTSFDRVIEEADLLICASRTQHFLVTQSDLKKIVEQRPGRPLVIIDIAVPRNVDPQVQTIPNVQYFDLEHLNGSLEMFLAERAGQIPFVQAILDEEQANFMKFYRSRNVLPVIAQLYQQAETIRREELTRSLRKLPELTDQEKGRIELLTKSLVKKILENPTRRLQSDAGSEKADQLTTATRTLFGLAPDMETPEISRALETFLE